LTDLAESTLQIKHIFYINQNSN